MPDLREEVQKQTFWVKTIGIRIPDLTSPNGSGTVRVIVRAPCPSTPDGDQVEGVEGALFTAVFG